MTVVTELMDEESQNDSQRVVDDPLAEVFRPHDQVDDNQHDQGLPKSFYELY